MISSNQIKSYRTISYYMMSNDMMITIIFSYIIAYTAIVCSIVSYDIIYNTAIQLMF